MLNGELRTTRRSKYYAIPICVQVLNANAGAGVWAGWGEGGSRVSGGCKTINMFKQEVD